MQEMWRLYAAGELEDDQEVMFRSPRPAEELYDTENDQYELNNLAEDAGHEDVLERMRGALAQWQSEFGDMGNISEEQMVATWYPDGTQPQTAAPIFIPINAEHPGTEVIHEVGEWAAPLVLQLHCSTQGGIHCLHNRTRRRCPLAVVYQPTTSAKGRNKRTSKSNSHRLW